MWQVFQKDSHGFWYACGKPTSRDEAREEVARRKREMGIEKFMVVQPHCVPINLTK